jgi:hypothetical protein
MAGSSRKWQEGTGVALTIFEALVEDPNAFGLGEHIDGNAPAGAV